MPVAMPVSNAQAMLVANHATNATNERNVRHQDSGKSSHFPDAGKPVDNGQLALIEEVIPRDATTTDSLGHAFCVECYPSSGAVIVSLCGVLRDEQEIGDKGACECVVCETFTACPSCGLVFYKPWAVA